jgi:uncharacterized protein (TIGR00369 family)
MTVVETPQSAAANEGRATAPDPAAWQRTTAQVFALAPFVHENGIRLVACEPGWCESSVELTPHHFQHTGVPHAGLIATLADHTSGAAAMSVCAPGTFVLTAEFKLSLLRAVPAVRLHCRADVVKPGSQLTFAEASVEGETKEGERKLVARASVTLAVVPASRLARA